MLKVKPVKQRPSYCGPACLEMIFSYYGVLATQDEIGRVAGTTLEHGTSQKAMCTVANRFGFTMEVRDDVTIADIKRALAKNILVIVDYFESVEIEYGDPATHYSVAIGVDDLYIYLINPFYGKRQKILINRFVKIWFGFTRDVISKRNLYIRRAFFVWPDSSKKQKRKII